MLASILLALLGGCARYYWTKPGSTVEQFARDSQECARDAAAGPVVPGENLLVGSHYRACLTARGYTREKQYEPPPPGFYRGME